MSKLRIANMIAATGLVTSGIAAAQTSPDVSRHPYYRHALSATVTTGCDKLAGPECSGTTSRIEWRIPPHHGLGETRMGVEHFTESMGKHFFTRRFDKSYGNANIDLNWAGYAAGTRVTLDQAFRLGENAQAEIGIFVGHVKADLSANASAGMTIYPRVISIPATRVGEYTLPPVSYEYKGHTLETARHWGKNAASYEGGVRGAAGWSMALPSPRLRAGLNGFGEFSALRARAGAGASLYYSSSPDSKLGTGPGGECAGSPLRSSARFAFAVGACATKVARDSLIDLETRYADRLGNRINGHINGVNDRISEATRNIPQLSGYALPTLERPGPQVAEVLGFPQDYRRVKAAFVVSAAARIGENGAVSVSHMQMADDSRTSLSFGYQFK